MDEQTARDILDASGEPIQQPSPIDRMGWTGKSADVRLVRATTPTTGADDVLLAPIDQRQRQYLERRCEHE